ncbi:T9SS type A sorting domain-containing protein [candidate division KSB1 bacterium]
MSKIRPGLKILIIGMERNSSISFLVLFFLSVTLSLLNPVYGQDSFLNTRSNSSKKDLVQSTADVVTDSTILPPSGLNAYDLQNDNGGYICIAFKISPNHPGYTQFHSDTVNRLYIDYYQIYRGDSPDFEEAVSYTLVSATPVTINTGETVRAVISTRGSNGENYYYWVSAVHNSYLYTDNFGKKTILESESAGPNRAMSVVDRNDNRADFSNNGTADLRDFDALLWSYYNEDDYDAVLDMNGDGSINDPDVDIFSDYFGNPVYNDNRPVFTEGLNSGSYLDFETEPGNTKDEFILKVFIRDVNMLSGYSFSLNYNHEVYEILEIIDEGFLESMGGEAPFFLKYMNNQDPVSVLNLLKAPVRAICPGGDGLLASVRFRWLGGFTEPVTIENIEISDKILNLNTLQNVIIEKPVEPPDNFILENNYPNPFNPETTIRYSIPKTADVKLAVYNVLGQEIKALVNENKKAGYHSVKWDGTNNYGVKVGSGIYIYRIRAGGFTESKKMVLLK